MERGLDRGVAPSECIDAESGEEIEIPVALGIEEVGPFAAHVEAIEANRLEDSCELAVEVLVMQCEVLTVPRSKEFGHIDCHPSPSRIVTRRFIVMARPDPAAPRPFLRPPPSVRSVAALSSLRFAPSSQTPTHRCDRRRQSGARLPVASSARHRRRDDRAYDRRTSSGKGMPAEPGPAHSEEHPSDRARLEAEDDGPKCRKSSTRQPRGHQPDRDGQSEQPPR